MTRYNIGAGAIAAGLAIIFSTQVALGTVITRPVLFFGSEISQKTAEVKPTSARSNTPNASAVLPASTAERVEAKPPQNNGKFTVMASAVTPSENPAVAFPRSKPAQTRPAPAATNNSKTQSFTIDLPRKSQSYLTMATPPSIEYHIPHRPQEEPLWCWAAAAQQAIGWVNSGRAPAQCAIVALAHGIPVEDCCNDRDGICAKTGEIPAIGALVRRFGGDARELVSPPATPEITYNLLKSGDTLLIRLRPEPHDAAIGIRHMIVVRGIEWIRMPSGALQATLLYNDPLGDGQRSVSFHEIVDFFEQALVVGRKL